MVPIAAWAAVGPTDRPQSTAGVRVGAWTYVEYGRGGAELYDRTRDPFEMYNLADDPAYADVRAALSSLTERYRACAGDTCPREFYAGPTRSAGPDGRW